MNKYIRKKLITCRAFTLAETLLAVLILLMVSSIVAAGIPSARNAYEKVVLSSNAEVLLSTTIATLRNELGTAMDVKTSGNEITYYNTSRGATSKIALIKVSDASPDTETTIALYRYFGNLVQESTPERIATSSSSSGKRDLYVKYTGVECTNNVITFSGLKVNQSSGKSDIAALDTFSIRLISK